MAMMRIGTTPEMIANGDKKVLVTTSGEFYYGFGDDVPDTWHLYYTDKEAVEFDVDYGPVWVKTADASEVVTLNISVAKV